MITRQTTLILGAGSSKPYGLPVGSELRSKILKLSEDQISDLPIAANQQREYGTARAFLPAFRRSHDKSIDAFLARNDRYVEIGVHAIAAALLPMEKTAKLLDEEPDDHWYQELLDAMDAPWEQLSSNKISFVTFNYDRSLECFLAYALANRFDKSIETAMAFVETLQIVHVYGCLGSLDLKQQNFVPYGGGNGDPKWILPAAAGLKVIAQGRENSPEFVTARDLIRNSERICFLGFGFDETNIARLGGQDINVGVRTLADGSMTIKQFSASALGMTPAEVSRTASLICNSLSPITQSFIDAKCAMTLRRTLILK